MTRSLSAKNTFQIIFRTFNCNSQGPGFGPSIAGLNYRNLATTMSLWDGLDVLKVILAFDGNSADLLVDSFSGTTKPAASLDDKFQMLRHYPGVGPSMHIHESRDLTLIQLSE
jgi:hypothetical protein